jgi:hypothetical protein
MGPQKKPILPAQPQAVGSDMSARERGHVMQRCQKGAGRLTQHVRHEDAEADGEDVVAHPRQGDRLVPQPRAGRLTDNGVGKRTHGHVVDEQPDDHEA